MELTTGLKGTARTTVTDQNTAATMGSGDLQVFATPSMVALMEKAALTSIVPCLAEGEGSVGISLSVSHQSATPLGLEVWAESELLEVDGKKLTFKVTAFDSAGVIGTGEHQRFIIQNERFMQKASQKA
ncbi:MAG: thioesterase family protein [Eubacteriales bacterium]